MNDFEEQGTRKSLHDGYKAKSCVGDACVGTKKGIWDGRFWEQTKRTVISGMFVKETKGFQRLKVTSCWLECISNTVERERERERERVIF
jgi:hypothetical protein